MEEESVIQPIYEAIKQYPDKTKDFKAQKEDLRQRDYELKKSKYEEVYGKKLDYSFEKEDIAGYK